MKTIFSFLYGIFYLCFYTSITTKPIAIGKKTALLVGVVNTDVPHFDNTATSDAHIYRDNVKIVLEHKGFVDIQDLDDPKGDDFLINFSNKVNSLQEEDLLVLYFYGHGGQIEDKNGDEDDKWDETLVLKDRQVLDDEIYEILNSTNSVSKVIMVIEACNSGSIYMMHEFDQNKYGFIPKYNLEKMDEYKMIQDVGQQENFYSRNIRILNSNKNLIQVMHDPLTEKLQNPSLDLIYFGASTDGISIPSNAFNDIFIQTILSNKANDYNEFYSNIKDDMLGIYDVMPTYFTEFASEEFINSKPFNN